MAMNLALALQLPRLALVLQYLAAPDKGKLRRKTPIPVCDGRGFALASGLAA